MVQRDGRYRFGTFTVSTVDDLLFWFNSNADGQIVAGGDSGGPSFVTSAAGVPCLVWRPRALLGCRVAEQQLHGPRPGTFIWHWTTAIGRCGGTTPPRPRSPPAAGASPTSTLWAEPRSS